MKALNDAKLIANEYYYLNFLKYYLLDHFEDRIDYYKYFNAIIENEQVNNNW